jgi:hypothetical protein
VIGRVVLCACWINLSAPSTEISRKEKNMNTVTTDTATATTSTTSAADWNERYKGNKVFNLEPQQVLSQAERELIAAELAPAIVQVRIGLSKQRQSIIEAFSIKSRLHRKAFPADQGLDYATAGYAELERWLEEIFIDTLDLQDLIAKGTPTLLVMLRLMRIQANAEAVAEDVTEALEKLEWREIELSASRSRNYRLPYQERTDVDHSNQPQQEERTN